MEGLQQNALCGYSPSSALLTKTTTLMPRQRYCGGSQIKTNIERLKQNGDINEVSMAKEELGNSTAWIVG